MRPPIYSSERLNTRATYIQCCPGQPREFWLLHYRLKSDSLAPAGGEGQGDGASWTIFTSGSHSVTTGPLATFDPTLLLNGIYEIQLPTPRCWKS